MTVRFSRRAAAKGLTAAAVSPLALTACGNRRPEHPTDLSQSDIDKAMDTPTEISYWTWTPGIEREVAMFEEAYPAIKVNVVNAGQGGGHYAKLRTALRAGDAPDAAQIEFYMIPSFAITDDLVDLRPYGADAIADKFADFAWGKVLGENGEVWAMPQDAGPMGMLYREDILSEHGIEVPQTWDAFAEAAAAMREADPEVYLTNLLPGDGQFFDSLLWQAGADVFAGSEGTTVRIDATSEAAEQVVGYWSELARQDLVSVDPGFNDQWYQAFNRGKYATWVAPAWAPTFLATAAESTSGNWRVASMPQWEADAPPVTSIWGGSTSSVMATTENPIPAAVFVQFLNSDPDSAFAMATEQFLFPTTKAVLQNPDFTGQEPDFYGGQTVNQVFADISETYLPDFTWSPFQSQVYADYGNTVSAAFTQRGDAVAALADWESRITEYALNQGFTVEGS
ncbi:ABC transporter substrate-binding protein [Glycomyces tenuis]|uniref:ABC transporter substrate-binding protein n=1 Tax=Glycomyces tenuis TaxID=58116 RepID=UPI00041518FA|nr:extracellular solute-binding protein [Glycomyces tenuis]